jgi:hypothetical protein
MGVGTGDVYRLCKKMLQIAAPHVAPSAAGHLKARRKRGIRKRLKRVAIV